VTSLIDAFFDPLIERGIARTVPSRDDTLAAEAA
jgi:hypothetical protein